MFTMIYFLVIRFIIFYLWKLVYLHISFNLTIKFIDLIVKLVYVWCKTFFNCALYNWLSYKIMESNNIILDFLELVD